MNNYINTIPEKPDEHAQNKDTDFFVPCLYFFCHAYRAPGPDPRKLRTIIVDAGRGGTDNGTVGQYETLPSIQGKDVTLDIALKVVAELKKQLPEVNIVPTRTTDIYQDPREKSVSPMKTRGDLFLCIHADSGPLKTGRRQIGTRTVTRYKVTHKGKGKKKKTIRTPYTVEEPVYEYFKLPLTRNGTSVWIFAAHKTSDKLKAIMQEEGEFEVESGSDSTYNSFDFNTPRRPCACAGLCQTLPGKKRPDRHPGE